MIDQPVSPVSTVGRVFVLLAGFFGWFFAGVQLAVNSLVMRDAAKDLLGESTEGEIGRWFGWLIASFLIGAACGGYLFGWVGDRIGRAKAMALSIGCYSVFVGLTYFVQEPWQLLALRFLACLGVGGMWPNGIALVSEAWPNVSRPILAGVIGTSANVGILLFATLACFIEITPDHWRWTMLVGAAPLLLAVFSWFAVPESPRWLALQRDAATTTESKKGPAKASMGAVFTPPILWTTILGILLGTIPLFGGWGSSNWANAWASQIGDKPQKKPQDSLETKTETETTDGADSELEENKAADPGLKARVLIARAAPGSVSSLLGGGLAVLLGRRLCYFLLSAAGLAVSQILFRFYTPEDVMFLWLSGALGFFSGFFFGWLPLCLPEMFSTRVRATGAGVSFNFGRLTTALGVLIAAQLLKQTFGGDYGRIGALTSFVYALGMVVILFFPRDAGRSLDD